MNSNTFPKPFLTFSFTVLALAPVVTKASELPQEIPKKTDTIEVMGTPSEAGSGVDQTDIDLQQANDFEDLFSATPNMAVGGSQSISQKIYLRGIQDTKLNVSIDGASQVGQVFQGQGRLAVEPMLLKKVRVSPGAGSALDGFGALGGSIHFQTKNAEDFLHTDQQQGAVVTGRYNTNNNGTHVNTHLFGRLDDNWSALASFGAVDTGNVKDGGGNTYSSTEAENSYQLFKLSGALSDQAKLSLSYDNRKDEGVRPLRSVFRVSDWNPAGWQANNREAFTAAYEFNAQNTLLNLTINAYKTRNSVSIMDGAEQLKGYVDSYGIDLRNTMQFAEHDLIYGYAYRHDNGVFSSRNASEKGQISGLYFQGDSDLGDSLSVGYGGRYDYYQLDTYAGHHLVAKGMSPNANLRYLLSDSWAFKLGYARALRGPSVKQVFAIKSSPSGPDLKEEKASNTEVSLEYSDDRFSAGISAFATEIKDVIGFEGTIGPQNRTYENLGDLKTLGYSLWLEQHWDNTTLRAVYSVTDPELNGEPLNDKYVGVGTAFGNRLVINASHYIWKHNLELGWQGTFVKALNNPDPITGKKPGYGVHNLYMQWHPSTHENVELTLSVHNLFDHEYYDHATFRYDPQSGDEIGIPALGRDVRLAMRWYM